MNPMTVAYGTYNRTPSFDRGTCRDAGNFIRRRGSGEPPNLDLMSFFLHGAQIIQIG